jgi:pimeloyl-ACP methyl ester carboxylesterase
MKTPKIDVPNTVLYRGSDRATLPQTSANKEEFFTKDYQRFIISEIDHFIQREDTPTVITAILTPI